MGSCLRSSIEEGVGLSRAGFVLDRGLGVGEYADLPSLHHLAPSCGRALRRIGGKLFFFFFVQSYAYKDYGGTLFYPVSVCRPGPKVGLDGSPSADKLSAL